LTALVRSDRKTSHFNDLGVTVCKASLNDRDGLAEAVRGQDVVINLAHDFKASGRRNIQGFTNLVEACSGEDVARLVHTSSIVVYDGWPDARISESSPRGGPGFDYKNVKCAMEEILLNHAHATSLGSVIIQPTIVYGPESWLWTDQIVERLSTGTLILPKECRGVCNAVYVDDVADALILAAKAPCEPAETFIISGPDVVTWQEFFESYDRALGTNSIQYVDAQPTEPGTASLTNRLKAIAANPLKLASGQSARVILGLAERVIGKPAIERLRTAIIRIKTRRGPLVYYPTNDEILLYRAHGQCHIDKAIGKLGYSPAFDFASGAAQTAEYLTERLNAND
jgi:nucleoside-diphosphate-sugar epimerase